MIEIWIDLGIIIAAFGVVACYISTSVEKKSESPHSPLIIAHRAGGGQWPQNSRTAVMNCIDKGRARDPAKRYHGIEIDIVLTKDGHHLGGFDYIMFIHELPWELADDNNKRRILSHELRHCFIDDKGKCKVVKHDIEDFYAEVDLNKDDPAWAQALGTIAMAKYEQIKEEEKMNR